MAVYKSMMLHQFRHGEAVTTVENTAAEWAATLRLGGIDIFKPKTHQHLNFIGNGYDTHPTLAFRSLDDVKRRYDEFGAEGIRMVPWCVPMGLNVQEEADLAIEVARACGNRIEIDLEPYEDFWYVPQVGKGGIPEYFDRIKQAGVSIDCDVDTRSCGLPLLGLDRVVHCLDRVLSQSYWVWFGRPCHPVIQESVAALRAIGVADVGVIFDHGGGSEYPHAFQICPDLGVTEISVWVADYATPRTYEGMAQIEGRSIWEDAPERPEPTPAEKAAVALGETYRILHLLRDLAPPERHGEAQAAVNTAVSQIDVLKHLFGLH